MVKFCWSCGAPTVSGRTFCASCGTNLTGTSPQEVEPSAFPVTTLSAPPASPAQQAALSAAGPAGADPEAQPWTPQTTKGCALSLLGVGSFLLFFANPHQFGLFLWVGVVLLAVGLLLTKAWVAAQNAAQTVKDLAAQSNSWTKPLLVRSYKNTPDGRKKAEFEAEILVRHGYALGAQSGSGSHVNIGRTVTGAALTGGLTLMFGGSRTGSTVEITFVKQH